jgi:hypothetical protein
VIYEHGEPRLYDIDGENSCFIHQISLAILPTVIKEQNRRNWSKEINFVLRSISLFILGRDF